MMRHESVVRHERVRAGTRVAPDRQGIAVDGREAALSAGVNATVEIKTGDRPTIEFLLAPLFRYRDAWRALCFLVMISFCLPAVIAVSSALASDRSEALLETYYFRTSDINFWPIPSWPSENFTDEFGLFEVIQELELTTNIQIRKRRENMNMVIFFVRDVNEVLNKENIVAEQVSSQMYRTKNYKKYLKEDISGSNNCISKVFQNQKGVILVSFLLVNIQESDKRKSVLLVARISLKSGNCRRGNTRKFCWN